MHQVAETVHGPIVSQCAGDHMAAYDVARAEAAAADDGDDDAAVHPLADAGAGAEPPEPLQRRSQQCCACGGVRVGAAA